MAKLFQTNNKFHPQCYALQQPEDIIVAGAYLDLQVAANRHPSLLKILDQYWLMGHGLSDRALIWLNDVRRREGQPEITFVDGHSTTYSLLRGEQKAAQRRNIVERLRDIREASPLQYAGILERAQAAARSIPSRDPLLCAELRRKFYAVDGRAGLSQHE